MLERAQDTGPIGAARAGAGPLPAAVGAAGVLLGYVLGTSLSPLAGLPAALLLATGAGAIAAVAGPAAASLMDRRRLARDLHDGPAQSLADVVLRAGTARMLVAAGRAEEASIELAGLEGAARDATAELRRTVAALRKEPSARVKLPAALEALVREQQHYGLDCHLQVQWPPDLRLPAVACRELTAITREALTNARRHASGARVQVRLEASESMALLVIEDEGPGIGRPRAGRYGLKGMRERAQRAGGRLVLESGPGGTLVRVLLPFAEVEDRERPSTACR